MHHTHTHTHAHTHKHTHTHTHTHTCTILANIRIRVHLHSAQLWQGSMYTHLSALQTPSCNLHFHPNYLLQRWNNSSPHIFRAYSILQLKQLSYYCIPTTVYGILSYLLPYISCPHITTSLAQALADLRADNAALEHSKVIPL